MVRLLVSCGCGTLEAPVAMVLSELEMVNDAMAIPWKSNTLGSLCAWLCFFNHFSTQRILTVSFVSWCFWRSRVSQKGCSCIGNHLANSCPCPRLLLMFPHIWLPSTQAQSAVEVRLCCLSCPCGCKAKEWNPNIIFRWTSQMKSICFMFGYFLGCETYFKTTGTCLPAPKR